jgi:predicted TIM-barrel fold metal-dependent hydrolase
LLREAPGRVLWGTDFPHPNLAIPVEEQDLLDLVPLIAPHPADQQRYAAEQTCCAPGSASRETQLSRKNLLPQ